MNQVQFEKLSRTLLNVIRRVRDEESLLLVSCRLLGADVALLLRRDSVGERREEVLRHVHPPEYRKLLEDDNLVSLLTWYDFQVLPPDIDGFTKEGPIQLGVQKFPDALVAFGDRLPDRAHPRHEMILLKKSGDKQPYRSYHCWAATQLIRQFEFFDLQETLRKETERRLSLETQLKDQYAASMSLDVLPNEKWEDLKKRMKDHAPDVRWLSYVIWTGYQVRKLRAGYAPAGSADSVRSDGEIGEPPEKIFGDVIDSLLDRKDLNKDTLFSEKEKRFREENNRMWSQLAVLVLEHAWRNLLQETSYKISETSTAAEAGSNSQSHDCQNINMDKAVKSARNLLGLTRGVVIKLLTSRGSKNGEEDDNNECMTPGLQELGRGFLRLYLAQEIAKPESRLEQLYLDLGGVRKSEHREAPPELKRTFIVNMSRFMLSVVALIEKQVKISNDPPVVTPDEELDSLLYLIDRFVHVELEVDERINIRQHLSRQIDSEVHHYLTKPQYRDHLLHVIDVFLLGHLLLNTELHWTKERTISLVEHLSELPAPKASDDGQPTPKMDDWMRNWAVASLLHDIGYQITPGSSISSDPRVWESYFALTGPVFVSWLKFKGDGKENRDSQSQKDRLDSVKNFAEELLREHPALAKYLPKIDDNNTKDHGVLSAIRVAQIIHHVDHRAQTDNKPDGSDMATCYRHAIHAIAYHNLCYHKVSFEWHPLACLLRLCDELQEWQRRKVNMEKVVKHLYLDLQEGHLTALPSYEMFESFRANLKLEPIFQNDIPISMEVSLNNEKPWFQFALIYRDSIEARFHPAMTLLCKAYNLQHLDLDVSNQGTNDLKFSINLQFPSPTDYGGLTEYDIYALFTEEVRALPLLRQFVTIQEAEAGLFRLGPKDEKPSRGDCFGIVLTKAADPVHHHGWLSVNPDHFFDRFTEFKKDILASRGAWRAFSALTRSQ